MIQDVVMGKFSNDEFLLRNLNNFKGYSASAPCNTQYIFINFNLQKMKASNDKNSKNKCKNPNNSFDFFILFTAK